MYSFQRELLQAQKEVQLTSIYGEPSVYSIVRGFSTVLEELGALNKASVKINQKEIETFDELGYSFFIDRGGPIPVGPLIAARYDFLDVGIQGFIEDTIDEKVFFSAPEQGTYYLLALGLIDLDSIHGIYVDKDETGLPFSFFLSKKEDAFDGFYCREESFVSIAEGLAMYGLIKQLFDEDYTEVLSNATANAELLHHRLYQEGTYSLKEHSLLSEGPPKSTATSISRKVVTPRMEVGLDYVDLYDYTKIGLRPAYAHLLYLAYFGKIEEDREYGRETLKTSLLM